MKFLAYCQADCPHSLNVAWFHPATCSITSEKRIGKFAVPIQLGGYLFYSEVGQLFQNIGIKYYLNRKWAFGGYLLAHWGKADFMHYGIDYLF